MHSIHLFILLLHQHHHINLLLTSNYGSFLLYNGVPTSGELHCSKPRRKKADWSLQPTIPTHELPQWSSPTRKPTHHHYMVWQLHPCPEIHHLRFPPLPDLPTPNPNHPIRLPLVEDSGQVLLPLAQYPKPFHPPSPTHLRRVLLPRQEPQKVRHPDPCREFVRPACPSPHGQTRDRRWLLHEQLRLPRLRPCQQTGLHLGWERRGAVPGVLRMAVPPAGVRTSDGCAGGAEQRCRRRRLGH